MGATINEPQQARSRETLARLTDAAFEVVSRVGFEGATVPDIVAEAGVSTGAFYARFPSKDALFAHLDDYIFERSLRLWREWLDPERWHGAGAEEILRGFIGETAATFRRKPVLNRSVAQRWRAPAATPELRRTATAYYRGVGDALVRVLEPEAPRFAADDWSFRVRFLVEVIEATLLERIAFADRAVTTARMSRERVVDELTDIAVSYLRLRPRR